MSEKIDTLNSITAIINQFNIIDHRFTEKGNNYAETVCDKT